MARALRRNDTCKIRREISREIIFRPLFRLFPRARSTRGQRHLSRCQKRRERNRSLRCYCHRGVTKARFETEENSGFNLAKLATIRVLYLARERNRDGTVSVTMRETFFNGRFKGLIRRETRVRERERERLHRGAPFDSQNEGRATCKRTAGNF